MQPQNTRRKPVSPDTIIFDPNEGRELAVAAALQNVEDYKRTDKKGIRLGIKCVDTPKIAKSGRLEYFLPLGPSELMSVIGRPSHGKTQLMMHMALTHTADLEQADIVNRATIVASWEQSVEDMVTYSLARQTGIPIDKITIGNLDDHEIELVKGYPTVRAGEQLFVLGFSRLIQARRPAMTMDVIYQAVDLIQNWNGVKNAFIIDLVVLDYLQRIPYDARAESKTVGISRNVDLVKDLSLQYACSVVLGSQAKKAVEDRNDKQPEGGDSEYTDNLFQSSDRVVSVMSPHLYYDPGDEVNGVLLARETLHQTMHVRVCKQKRGASEFVRMFLFDTSRCRYIGDLTTKEVV